MRVFACVYICIHINECVHVYISLNITVCVCVCVCIRK